MEDQQIVIKQLPVEELSNLLSTSFNGLYTILPNPFKNQVLLAIYNSRKSKSIPNYSLLHYQLPNRNNFNRFYIEFHNFIK
jgi:hypothetical protein